jgi:acyl dehydratase
LLHELCGSDVARFKSMDARFSKPVYPGDTLTVRMWDEGAGQTIFQTVNQDGVVVIDGGRFQLA